MDLARSGMSVLAGLAAVAMACRGPTEAACVGNVPRTLVIDPRVANTVHTPGAPASALRIAAFVNGSCGAVGIGGLCTRDPSPRVWILGGTVTDSAREVRITLSDSVGGGYALVVPQ